MASAVAAPIRQPRGPSSNSFGVDPSPATTGPPAPDSDSLLRRHNTVSNPRHQGSASISSTPAASSAFHGAKYKVGGGNLNSRLRSGSLSSGSEGGQLSRKGSGRTSVRTEDVVIESREEGTEDTGGQWGKGLSRQSSLPSRRGLNPVNAVTAVLPMAPPEPPRPTIIAPPPRPPRRISVAVQSSTPPPPAPNHSASHSLSSLAMFYRPNGKEYLPSEEVQQQPMQEGATVSRTQSLRAQAKNADAGVLGRSASLRSAGEQQYLPMQGLTQTLSPPTLPPTPQHLFTPPTPPPMSSSAALPPMQLLVGDQIHHASDGADIKRHQSLTQGYGSSSRVRERLERSPALLSMEQREGVRRRLSQEPNHARKISEDREEPPTSPIGRSVWSMSHPEDDGWSRPGAQQLQDAFEAMQLGRRMMGMENGQKERASPSNDMATARHPTPNSADRIVPSVGPPGEEPSWVAGLVGMPDRLSPQPVTRVAAAPRWQDREAFQLGEMPQRWPEQQNQFMGQPTAYHQQHQHQQQLLASQGYGHHQGMKQNLQVQPQIGQYQQPYQLAYLGTPFTPMYPTSPVSAMPPSAMPAQDQDVIDLARRKGLNPASFNCRPSPARFFVIKSYTEEDVQKSLKHEIWSSTVLGNKRLDAAFRESAEKMPLYLFFSVNGSRHFCGVAQMLTTVDETQTSSVWAQDKWKGIFKVKWIFVRDVPTGALRHIRLLNTPEQKPITNSRDTQELHHEAGCEVLQIFLDHQTKSKTSLLQDFAYYEQLAASRATGPPMPPPPQPPAPPAMSPYNMPSPMSVGQMLPPPIPARFR